MAFPSLQARIEAADLDNDGDLDIITSSDARSAISVPVAVFTNLGNGTFTGGQQNCLGWRTGKSPRPQQRFTA